MLRVMALISLVAGPGAGMAGPEGAWCNEAGFDVITIAEHGVFLTPQTACLLDTPFPADGVFTGQLHCTVTVMLDPEFREWQHIETLVTLETQPLDEGRLGVRFGVGEMGALLPCEAVWPL